MLTRINLSRIFETGHIVRLFYIIFGNIKRNVSELNS
jgi:hypothetical protein